jgi:Family of unknown function (DUF5808)
VFTVTREELNRLWADAGNWSFVYRCAADPRVIVPRRRPWMGWTINFAHPRAWPVLALCVAIAVGPFVVLLRSGVTSVPLLGAVLVTSVLLLIGYSHWEASRSR